MPSLAVSKNLSSQHSMEKNDNNNKKMDRNMSMPETHELDTSIDTKKNKEKKSRESKTDSKSSESDSEELNVNDLQQSWGDKKKTKKKENNKRKALEIDDDDEEKSETSSELGEPMNLSMKGKKDKKKKKAKMVEIDEAEVEEENPNAIFNFRISEPLREEGIRSLFPIQAITFDFILDGSDLVGRVRTGQRVKHWHLCYPYWSP